MKVYRVIPDKRKKFTKYGKLGVLSMLATIVFIALFIYSSEFRPEIWIGSFVIDTNTVFWILMIIAFILMLACFYFFDKNSIEKRCRCWDVYITDNENHLYYVTLNRDAFDLKINLFTSMLRGSRHYHNAMINAWNRYCKDILCSDDIIGYLPAIIQGKITLNNCPALLALRILNVENIREEISGITFTFHADGSNRMWSAGVYDYMNDYTEIAAKIKQLAAKV